MIADKLEPLLTDKQFLVLNSKDIIYEISENIQSPSANYREEVLKAIEEIKSHNHNCTLDEIAKAVSLSPDRFRRVFKDEVGITFKNYIKWQKIRKAIFLIKQKKLSLSQVALESGFTDQSHMNKLIKENFGHTPKEIFSKINL